MVIQSHGVRFDSNQISEMDQGEHSGGRSDRQLRPPWRRVPQRLALVCWADRGRQPESTGDIMKQTQTDCRGFGPDKWYCDCVDEGWVPREYAVDGDLLGFFMCNQGRSTPGSDLQ